MTDFCPWLCPCTWKELSTYSRPLINACWVDWNVSKWRDEAGSKMQAIASENQWEWSLRKAKCQGKFRCVWALTFRSSVAEFSKEVWVTRWKQSQSLVGESTSCVNEAECCPGCDCKKKQSWHWSWEQGVMKEASPPLPFPSSGRHSFLLLCPASLVCPRVFCKYCFLPSENTSSRPDFWNFIRQYFQALEEWKRLMFWMLSCLLDICLWRWSYNLGGACTLYPMDGVLFWSSLFFQLLF